jgi:hypothetical protein
MTLSKSQWQPEQMMLRLTRLCGLTEAWETRRSSTTMDTNINVGLLEAYATKLWLLCETRVVPNETVSLLRKQHGIVLPERLIQIGGNGRTAAAYIFGDGLAIFGMRLVMGERAIGSSTLRLYDVVARWEMTRRSDKC